MAVLTVQRPPVAGAAITYAAAAAGGDDVPVTERTLVHVKNASASPITVTATSWGSANAVVVPNASDRMFPVLLGNAIEGGLGYSNTGYGTTRLTYTAVASVTVAVISV